MRRTLALAAVLAVASLACASGSGAPRRPKVDFDPVPLEGSQGVEDALGKLVVFEGVAENSRSGALVVGDGLSVQCQGVEAWPQSMLGRKVTVSGLLVRGGALQAPAGVGGSGAQEAPPGADLVLRHPKLE